MGMFDDKRYLTGSNGEFKVGDRFILHHARKGRPITINGKEREEVALTVSKSRDGDHFDVFTSGAAIVSQIDRMDDRDRAAFPVIVELSERPTTDPSRNAMHILKLVEQPS